MTYKLKIPKLNQNQHMGYTVFILMFIITSQYSSFFHTNFLLILRCY